MSDDDSDGQPIRIWVHGFDEQDVRRLAEGLDRVVAERQSFAPVFIHTDGGSTWGLGAMVDLFAACPVPVCTIAVGKCLSAGADLLAAGKKGARWVSPHTIVMVHESIEGMRPQKLTEANARMDAARREDAVYMSLMDKHCGKRPGYWQRAIRKAGNVDLWMSATEAVGHCLADYVGLPRIFAINEHHVDLSFEAPAPAKVATKKKRGRK